MNLEGKNVLYIGASGGIGQEACKELLRKNVANLVILDKDIKTDVMHSIEIINDKVELYKYIYDNTVNLKGMKAKFHEILNEIKHIDVLINGAGICNDHLVEETIQVNLTGVINTIIAASDYMDKRKGGKGGLIVNLASVAGLTGFPMIPVYSATKAGLISFTKSFSQLEPLTGIKAIALCPGITKTNILDGINTFLDSDPNLSAKVANAPLQSSEICGKNLIAAIEKHENGGIYILNNDAVEKVELPSLWKIPEGLL